MSRRGAATRPRRRSGGQARRPGQPVRRRLRARLPSAARVFGVLLFAGLVGGLVALVNGPWLRVGHVAATGAAYTVSSQLDALLEPYDGASLLTLDSAALAARLRALPAVADARVRTEVPDRLAVTITEKEPAAVWITRERRLLTAADGSFIAELPPDTEVPDQLGSLIIVDDQRSASRYLAVGDALPAAELRAAERLLAIDPRVIGSKAKGFALRVDDEYGFILVSGTPAWEVAFGFYQLDPVETEAVASARLEGQLAAVRTLFTGRAEASIGWVDARNPRRVYWAP